MDGNMTYLFRQLVNTNSCSGLLYLLLVEQSTVDCVYTVSSDWRGQLLPSDSCSSHVLCVQCEGKSYRDKSDIWALGCILYEMACQQKTFDGSNLPAVVNKIMKVNSSIHPLITSHSVLIYQPSLNWDQPSSVCYCRGSLSLYLPSPVCYCRVSLSLYLPSPVCYCRVSLSLYLPSPVCYCRVSLSLYLPTPVCYCRVSLSLYLPPLVCYCRVSLSSYLPSPVCYCRVSLSLYLPSPVCYCRVSLSSYLPSPVCYCRVSLSLYLPSPVCYCRVSLSLYLPITMSVIVAVSLSSYLLSHMSVIVGSYQQFVFVSSNSPLSVIVGSVCLWITSSSPVCYCRVSLSEVSSITCLLL